VSAADASLAPTAASVTVRRATEGDRQALTEMLSRCSGETRYRRFQGYVSVFPGRYLTEALSGSPLHYALVVSVAREADGPDGAVGPAWPVVALASCRAVEEGVAELGFLIEDAWQRRGIGGLLLREIAGHAARTGLRALTAQVLAEQSWIVGLLRRYGPCRTAPAGNALDVTLWLPR
jgi:GNAT superfamily N-acetyltransferase